LLLGRNQSAVSEFQTFAQLALHPMEKHRTTYFLARATAATGQAQEAARIFSLVITDGFNTWMYADARARLNSVAEGPGPILGPLTIGE
jgi:hypothetical protein